MRKLFLIKMLDSGLRRNDKEINVSPRWHKAVERAENRGYPDFIHAALLSKANVGTTNG